MKDPHTKTTSKIIHNLLWMSDLHLNYSTSRNYRKLLRDLKTTDYDAAVITGDTAAADTLLQHLQTLAVACAPRPLYVVLGNHDFYGSSLYSTQYDVRMLCHKTPNLHHLQDHGVVWLNEHTVLIGHHGWADARCGWGSETLVPSPDHRCIDDFRRLNQEGCFDLMKDLGKASTDWIRQNLNTALCKAQTVIVATHVPAFPTSALYNGTPCGPCHTPHYVHSSLGGLLIGTARHNKQTQFTILSGHTHSEVQEQILLNLESRVAGATRGAPRIQGVLSV